MGKGLKVNFVPAASMADGMQQSGQVQNGKIS